MDRKEHIEKHIMLHKYLDELSADHIRHTGKIPSKTTLMELMGWSYEQTKDPTEDENE